MIHFDTDAFCADLGALRWDMAGDGYAAWCRAMREAAEATTEHNYQNRTGRLTAERQVLPMQSGAFGWNGAIRWPTSYAKWVDDPTKAHAIVAKKAKMLRWYSFGHPVFRRAVWHPGTKGAGFSQMAALQFQFEAPEIIQHAVDAAVTRHP